VFTHIGFVLSTALLLIFLFRAIEPEKWKIAIGGAILALCFLSIVFSLWLDVQLPGASSKNSSFRPAETGPLDPHLLIF